MFPSINLQRNSSDQGRCDPYMGLRSMHVPGYSNIVAVPDSNLFRKINRFGQRVLDAKNCSTIWNYARESLPKMSFCKHKFGRFPDREFDFIPRLKSA